MTTLETEVVVLGAGPAGASATLFSAEQGARTALVTGGAFGGMAGNDGPAPVRVLSQAARMIREARQMGRFGIAVGDPVLDYPRLLARVREVVGEVREDIAVRRRIEALGAAVHEHAGAARFVDPHTIVTASGLQIRAHRFILCTGGVSRRLPLPGFELTSTHSDAWRLTSIPPSMLVVGGGDTGLQVASIFNAFGTRVQLLEAAPRILPHADDDVAAAVAAAFRASGVAVRENFGAIESFEKSPAGVRMNFTKDGHRDSVEATLAVVAVGWTADAAGLNLPAARVELTPRGFVQVDQYLRTTAPHIFAAGDVTGRLMPVPEALQDGYVAATNALRGLTLPVGERVSGIFADPEYAQVGLTEGQARQGHAAVACVMRFDATVRTVIDGHTGGFCKVIVDRKTARVLGCHVVGERAVDIVQVAAVAIAAGMRVDDLIRVPLSFPTNAGILVNAAVLAARELGLSVAWQAHQATARPSAPEALPAVLAEAAR